MYYNILLFIIIQNLFRSLDSDNSLEGNSGSGLDMETESAMDEWGSSFNQDSSVKSLGG